MKGLPVARKYEEVYVRIRLHDNLDYFAKIREGQMREKAQIKIAARWRGYCVRKKMKKPKK